MNKFIIAKGTEKFFIKTKIKGNANHILPIRSALPNRSAPWIIATFFLIVPNRSDLVKYFFIVLKPAGSKRKNMVFTFFAVYVT